MRIHRFLSLTDLVVTGVVLVAIFMPKRPLYAVDTYKLEEVERAELAAAEARTLLHPEDGLAAADLADQLSRAEVLDWAVEAADEGAIRAHKESAWWAMRAAAYAYADRIDVQPAFDRADASLQACRTLRATLPDPSQCLDSDPCPCWAETTGSFYRDYLEAGLKSGIDPRKEPLKFRAAADSGVRAIGLPKN